MAEWVCMFDSRREVTPPLDDEQLGAVPAKRGVLMLAGSGDRPITMLTAGDIRARLRTRLAEPPDDKRRRGADLRHITRAVLWKLTASHFETDLAFLAMVRCIWPRNYRSMLAAKRPWFVHVDCHGPLPHFARTRDVLGKAGQALGPFPTGRAAEQFVQGLQDAFDLCREVACLRTAPRGAPCAYAQMGRCLSPCDGTMSMADYRRVVGEAAAFAAGDRQPLRQRLQRQMSEAAEALEFEQAASIRGRLMRLAEFDQRAYALAAPLEAFRFLMVQRGPTPRSLATFLVNGPAVAPGPRLDYPLKEDQLAGVCASMASFAPAAGPGDDAGPWRMGLVSRYLFSGDERRGLILPWRQPITPPQLHGAISAAEQVLKVRPPKRRKKTAPAAGPDASASKAAPKNAPPRGEP